jgi:hypothetical protein
VRFDLCPVLPFLDDDGAVRLARVLAERDGRVCVMVTRGVGLTHVLWRPAVRMAGPVEGRRTTARDEASSTLPGADPTPRS